MSLAEGCSHASNSSACSKCSLNETFALEANPNETQNGNSHSSEISTPSQSSQEKSKPKEEECVVLTKPLVEPTSWTMRLISSDAFSVPMAIEYLHSIHDKPSLSFLGKRLFDLPEVELDFFLPQLMYLYVIKIDVASVTHAYIEDRHGKSAQFTTVCIWLLDCFMNAGNVSTDHGQILKKVLQSTVFAKENANVPKKPEKLRVLSTLSLENLKEENWVKPRKSVSSTDLDNDGFVDIQRNGSEEIDTITLERELSTKELLNYEQHFVASLIKIGQKLALVNLADSKQVKMIALKMDLQLLNEKLPAPVWIPFSSDHFILNICYEECSVLNSKDKVPYIIFVEVLRSPPNYFRNVRHLQATKFEESVNKSKKCNGIKMYHDTSDPSAAVFAEAWCDKKERIRMASNYGGHADWDLIPVIVKYGDDLSQESFAQQLLQIFKDLWQEENVPLYVRPYKIVCVGPDAGLIEPVLDTLSLHQIKRHLTKVFLLNRNTATPTLKHHFEDMFGSPGSEAYVNAQKNFIQSTAAYSLVSYFLQLKDRHNGNMLLDLEGHLIHIDYGFLLSSSPRNLGFETAPFKLTSELIEVMGGLDSDMFLYYKSLLLRGLMAARKHHRRIVSLAEIMSTGSKMQCFRAGIDTVRALEARFHVSSTDEQLQQLVDTLVDGSRDSYTTRFYDSFQYYTNGIH